MAEGLSECMAASYISAAHIAIKSKAVNLVYLLEETKISTG
jgi:hypothetical protein